jgi:hypothetical protein
VKNKVAMWDYFGFGAPATTDVYGGQAIDPDSQLGTLFQGDFGPDFCSVAGLVRLNRMKHKTFPCTCDPKPYLGHIFGDYFCSSVPPSRDVEVTAPCYDYADGNPLATLSDHGK